MSAVVERAKSLSKKTGMHKHHIITRTAEGAKKLEIYGQKIMAKALMPASI